jgi:hypothetical protein
MFRRRDTTEVEARFVDQKAFSHRSLPDFTASPNVLDTRAEVDSF